MSVQRGVCAKYTGDDVCVYACCVDGCVSVYICATEKLRLTQVSVEI